MRIPEWLVALVGRSRSAQPSRIECEDALRRLQEFLDGELEGMTAREVEAHFETCTRCYPRLRFERSFRDAVVRAATRTAAPARLRERLLQAISEA